MAEPEPRYVATFRPGTPEMVIVAVLIVLGAAFAVGLAWIAREIECSAEAYSECSGEGMVQLIIVIAGLVPALGTLVESGRKRGHPWLWFIATVLVYAVWGLYFSHGAANPSRDVLLR